MDYGTFLKKSMQDPARRSSGYRKQPAFKGSLRELRGGILRRLGGGGADLCSLHELAPGDGERLRSALEGLCRDALIQEEAGVYRLCR
jgi:A/G-specific adenine glycosylase